ncbi:hypothetical protein LTR96_003879 [Exophiala xenobiotica]|nr:hypothetical protein LTR72_002905 [Exophiala xenobiotica]KAK5234417.1 hypothetical protein LTR47_004450 [Exophiala xenobiotica]KAK5254890.1 hypothetical protein LTS06_001029 [Exophiala xenobiotica]KAK5270602.1 hypothetical protein LTR96_003879 [Exophiala xenobiotica]KAK5300666.1 hypothetical protein LTR14_001063 [Exophiala xenobiotica]
MNERTQIENELELLELEERQLLIERKKVELKQRLKAITTPDSVDLTIAGISPEVHKEQKQVSDEANGAVADVVAQNKKGDTSSVIVEPVTVEPVVAAAPTHASVQKQTRRATLREVFEAVGSSGTVGPHETTVPAVRQAVAETSLMPSPARKSLHDYECFQNLGPVTTRASTKRPRTVTLEQDKIATVGEEVYVKDDPPYARQTGATPAKRPRTNPHEIVRRYLSNEVD